MKKITAISSFTFPVNETWNTEQNTFNKLFAKLTSYDIMFEESRKDILTFAPSLQSRISTQAISFLLITQVKKCSNLLASKRCNNNR